ncbi:DUF7504 family protein [Halobacterium litoreum]|uniref:Halobacterial output domain-containing protein n=1 Tax=Halobacterium litoreum TaxID=2039234 RepID=A0ABD5N9L5_9EURY|nr:hypothetical protein [Halobacterium litoreum]UHH12040.1 hypothetical protein LT972_07705 [Halobacterium litoreum]
MGDSQSDGEWTTAPDTFTEALDDLKADGCMLLVVDGATDHVGCDRMLGDATTEDRRRLFVRADTAASPHVDAAAPDATARETVVYRTGARTATAAASNRADAPTAAVGDVDALAGATEDAVQSLAPPSGFESGQLRVCLGGVGDLLADDDLAAVVSYVRRLRETVTAADGMGHVHVDDRVPATAVEALLKQFDAVVEVADAGDARQRWHLPDESLSTEWLDL